VRISEAKLAQLKHGFALSIAIVKLACNNGVVINSPLAMIVLVKGVY